MNIPLFSRHILDCNLGHLKHSNWQWNFNLLHDCQFKTLQKLKWNIRCSPRTDLRELDVRRQNRMNKLLTGPELNLGGIRFIMYPGSSALYLDRVKRIWYLSPMRAAKVQAGLRIHAVSLEPPLLAHTSSESKGTFRQKARSLAPLNGWACAVKICHDGMLEDTNSLDGAHLVLSNVI